jgi:hypothetical protein
MAPQTISGVLLALGPRLLALGPDVEAQKDDDKQAVPFLDVFERLPANAPPSTFTSSTWIKSGSPSTRARHSTI